MVQLRILSGKQAGSIHPIDRFPCVVGRSASVNLRLEEPGVWDQHLRLELKKGEAFTLAVLPGALARVNGQPVEVVVLRGGDIIELGGTRLQFWLSPTRQRSYNAGEFLTWIALALLSAGQIALIYRLLR